MRKSLIVLVLIAIAGLVTLTACATASTGTTVDATEVAEVDVPETDSEAMASIPEFMSFTGTIVEIRPFYEFGAEGGVAVEGKFFVLVEGITDIDGYTPIVNFRVDESTLLLADKELEVGMVVIGFYETSLPMLMIYPPQYHARVLVAESFLANPDTLFGGVYVDRVDENWVAQNHPYPLQIQLEDDTEIVFEDGTRFTGELSELENRSLVILFGIMTRVAPGGTNFVVAEKIIILFERAVPPIHYFTDEELAMLEELDGFIQPDFSWQGGLQLTQEDLDMMWNNMLAPDAQVFVDGEAVDMPAPFINREAGFVMVPVAYIAEALGYATNMVSDTELMIGRSMVTVGLDSYAFGRMAAVELGAAPEIHDGVIFVPLHFFGSVFPDGAYIMDGNIFVNSAEV